MSSLILVASFSVVDLQLNADMVDGRIEIIHKGLVCHVVLPDPASTPGAESRRYRNHGISTSVIQVEVPIRTAMSADEFCSGSNSDDPLVAQALLQFQEAAGVAHDLADRFVDAVRANLNQSWIGSTALRGRMIHFVVRDPDGLLRDVPFGYGPVRFSSRAFTALSAKSSPSIVRWILEGRQLSLADAFLADAKHARERSDFDLRQIVLLAAIACELKIKETLVGLASDCQAALVELLFDAPRDFSMAAQALFDSALKAVCGRSMKEDDSKLHKGVAKLFTHRNRIAHSGGAGLSDSDLGLHLGTAEAAFFYLDNLARDSTPQGSER